MSHARWAIAAFVVAGIAHVRDADACGGCFVPREVSTVVTDHRMAFSISTKQSVLWDQIRYNGDPAEFAWVLPVRVGTSIEASNDAFFATLESVSVPTIIGPRRGGGGCGFGCSASSARSLDEDNGGVQVVTQKVVGPYESVTLRSSDPNALADWLKKNGYAIPTSIEPTIAAYVNEKFDFIALKLRPGQGIRAMRPVRIVYPGADRTLPLRMVAAGVGAQVAITLFVIGEGRYHPQNFPDAKLNESDLVWDNTQNRSNYAELSLKAMAQNDGKSWLTEAARPLEPTAFNQQYLQACRSDADGGVLIPGDAGSKDASLGGDAGSKDASLGDADAGEDAATDAGDDASIDAGTNPNQVVCDDVTVATDGLHASDVWLTRLRANLPSAALSTDLVLAASPTQAIQNNVYYATNTGSVRGGSGCSVVGEDVAAEASAALVGLLAILRRRRQHK